MKKFSLLSFFIMLAFCTAFSQKVTVSEDVSLRNDDGYALLGKMKNKVLLFRFRGNENEIQAFDHKLRNIWSKDIELLKKNPVVIEVIPGRDDFTVVFQHRKKGRLALRAHKYDAAAKLKDSVEIVDLGANWYAPKYRVVLSENKSKLLLYTFEKQTDVVAHSFDLRNMELLWSKKFKPENLSEPHDYQDFLVDNDGNFYFILEKDNRRVKMEDHRFEIYSVYADGTLLRSIVPVAEYQNYDVLFSYDNLNKKLKAAGLYSIKNRGRANGFFFLSVSVDAPEERFIRYEEFEESFLANISGNGVDEEKGISECDIQDIVLRRDGGLLFIVERNHQLERRSAGTDRAFGGREAGRFSVDYYNDDLFVYSVHPDGTVHWKTVMHKRQFSQDDGGIFSSYFLLKTPSAIRLIFNDEIRSENTVSEYVLHGNGEFDRNSVMSTESQNIRLRFREALQIGANEMIVPSEKRNRLRLVLVEY